MPCSIQFPGERRARAALGDRQAPADSLGILQALFPVPAASPGLFTSCCTRDSAAPVTHCPSAAASQTLLFSIFFSFSPFFLVVGL